MASGRNVRTTAGSPPRWSAWPWLATTSATRLTPRLRKNGTTTRRPASPAAPRGPPSITIQAPWGVRNTAASPWPTSRKCTVRPGAASRETARATSPHDTRHATHATRAAAVQRGTRQAHQAVAAAAPQILALPQPSAITTCPPGIAAATRAVRSSNASTSPAPAANSSATGRTTHEARSATNNPGTATAPSGIATRLATTPTGATVPKA